MLTLRPVQWDNDITVLSHLDTSFETDRIYVPQWEGLSFRLVEQCEKPLLIERYPFDPTDVAERQQWDYATIAEEDGQLAGFAAAQFMEWNRRVIVHHLYVMPAFRRQGVGKKLLDALDTYAGSVNARCLWVETQNVNAPAIEFYQRAGFEFCGLDSSLYDPESVGTDEIAVFFARPVGIALTLNAPNSLLQEHTALLLKSFTHWTGRPLIDAALPPEEQVRTLFHAPFALVSHGTEVIPIFNYANQQALALFEMTWEEFTRLPSRLSAEPMHQRERERLLSTVAQQGYIDNYRGIRIAKSGRRFWIENAIVWNLLDAENRCCGQAAMFDRWEFLPDGSA